MSGSRTGGLELPAGAGACKPGTPLAFPTAQAPTVPSQAGDRSAPWARTLPRGKKPSAQFPARLGLEAPALALAQAASAHALSGAGYWLAGGARELVARSAPGPCRPGTLPAADSLEVEVTMRAGWGWGGFQGPSAPSPPPGPAAHLARPAAPSAASTPLGQDGGEETEPFRARTVEPAAQGPGRGDWPAGSGGREWEPLAGPGAADRGCRRERPPGSPQESPTAAQGTGCLCVQPGPANASVTLLGPRALVVWGRWGLQRPLLPSLCHPVCMASPFCFPAERKRVEKVPQVDV